MKRQFTILSILLLPIMLHAQSTLIPGKQVGAKQYNDGWSTIDKALIYLPKDYNGNNKKYPLIIFFRGGGEAGPNVNSLLRQGIPKLINEGKPPYSVNATGDTTWFIVVSPQEDPRISNDAIRYWYNTLFNYYKLRIDTNRIYLAGLSRGAADLYAVMTDKASGYNPVATIFMSTGQAAAYSGNYTPYSNKHIWYFLGKSDNVVSDQSHVDYETLKSLYPKNDYRFTWFPGGHCCWNTYFDPSWHEDSSGGQSVYDYLMQFSLNNEKSQPTSNLPPIANAGADQTVTLPKDSITLNGSASSDPDGSIKSYQWTQKSGPSSAKIENAAIAKTKIFNLQSGNYVFILTITDNNGDKATDETSITVKVIPNQPPHANAGNDQTLTLPLNVATLDGSASSDQDGSISTYQWTQKSGPSSAKIENATITKTKVSNLQTGNYVFVLTITDNKGDKATDEISVTVKAAPNKAPVANAGSNRSITLPINSTILDGSASSDPDGNIESYQWIKEAGPTGYFIDNEASVKPKISGLTKGTYVFKLMVKDNKGEVASDNVTIFVNNPIKEISYLTPVAKAGKSQTISLPENSLTIDGSASEGRGGANIVAYQWTKTSGPSSPVFGNNLAAKTTISGLLPGTYVFTLLVTDNNGKLAKDQVTVTVKNPIKDIGKNPVYLTPVAKAGKSQTISLPENSLTLDGGASEGRGGADIVAYQWTKTSGPSSPVFGNNLAAKTTISGLLPGTYVFTLLVTDNNGKLAKDQVTVTVKNPNKNSQKETGKSPVHLTPVAKAGKNQTIFLPANSLTLDGSASEGRGGASIITYQWIKTSGPSSPVIGNNHAAKTTVGGLLQGTYVFTLLVTDNNGKLAKDPVTVTVKNPGKFEAMYRQTKLPVNALLLKNPKDSLISKLLIYPNPIQNELHLKFDKGNDTPIYLRIVNIEGKIIMGWNISGTRGEISETLDVSSLPPGIYLLQLVGSNGLSKTKKIIKY